jgi:hypothetical protein
VAALKPGAVQQSGGFDLGTGASPYGN